MSKKFLSWVWFINITAYSLLMSTVLRECETATTIKVIASSAIIFGSIWGILMSVAKKKDDN